MRVAVVGAGWAGLAAAVAATSAGHAVTVFEAARQFGGRARRLHVEHEGRSLDLDNGQHILIGAYSQTLACMRTVGIDPAQVLRRVPLVLQFPDGSGVSLPDVHAPWNVAIGILSARGWRWGEKLAFLREAARWRLRGFTCDPRWTVAQLCARVPERAMQDLVEPLCVAALNVPASRASASVFLRVLRDALFMPGGNGWAASDLLLPAADLGRLFPDAAASWLRAHGAKVLEGMRVQALQRTGEAWLVDGEPFDAVLLAASPTEAARLVEASGLAPQWAKQAAGLMHEPIATVYTHGGPSLPQPMLALRTGPAQFVFDRSQLGGPAGVLAWVTSASEGSAAELEAQVLAQAAALGWEVQALRTVVEKRATFACTPGVVRPPAAIAPGLVACGDYVDGPYPSTLEGAVRSALAAVGALTPATRTAA
ncbi:hydroxysqualene dehydroxylase HpnE [Ramlibacter algicola]|uniref:FAD-dependent oxidoreductase n=1 Tax=Ramlibacter algicola TaxID=2795217 RepID=A0A934Q0S7_9BURK|nr:hydroxysqualene dehydroxylase HpnE [Ramlibacter algicola]MBK0392983.1 FAD-dependent oxidoreductase [Ramlibacter algicola]